MSRFSVSRLLLGRRLANREQPQRRIGVLEGVPAMGLDGLGSSAYGPEAALTILAPLGALGLAFIGWIMAAIVALLLILFASYWQTIIAYPNNGGSYVVAKDNLGRSASLLAAAALMVDYVLNVAVGISAGVAALVSAVPPLQPFTLPLCLAILGAITLLNLRGTRDAGRLLAIPTYVFMGSFGVLIGLGVLKALASGGHPHPLASPPPLHEAVTGAGAWLLLRAFASGCTAMTGVEAVSNAGGAFKTPVVRNAHWTLTAIVGALAVLLAGIAYLARAYGVLSMDQTRPGYQSVLSQLAGAVVGRGGFYDLCMGSVLAVLALSANTSFVGFPGLCRMVAQDGFLPRPFAIPGRRLVCSVGVLYLAACAAVLLLVFGGITDRLIPLFAIGAFLTFAISQTGMVAHWRRKLRESADRRGRASHRLHLGINAAGATATGVALAIIVAAKFTEGAWITVIVIPVVILLLKVIRGYYDRLEEDLREERPLELDDRQAPVVLVVAQSWNRLLDKALRFALRLSPDVHVLHLTELAGPEDEDTRILSQWARDVEAPARASGLKPPRLKVLRSDYRLMYEPVLKLAAELEAQFPSRPIAVLLPELVKTSWWQLLLHSRRAGRLRSELLKRGGPRLVVIDIPWRPRAAEQGDPGHARLDSAA